MAKHLLAFFLLLTSLSAIGQNWQWVTEIPGGSSGKSVATDSNGNSFIAGNFRSSIDLGISTLHGSINLSGFVAKYDSNGKVIWARVIANEAFAETTDIAVDAAGNIYVAGYFYGSIEIGGYTLKSNTKNSSFLIKYDTAGNVLWAKQASSNDGDVTALGLVVDKYGNSYLTGNFYKTAVFGATTISTSKDEQVYIAKYNTSGEEQWVRKAGGLGICYPRDIAIDASGNLYITGDFWLTAAFGTTVLQTIHREGSTTTDIFLAKFDAAGNALWAKQAGNEFGNDAAMGVTADNQGNSYITGYFQGVAAFGTSIITGTTEGNIFIASYDALGKVRWVNKQENTGKATGTSIVTDNNGKLYVAGNFQGVASFGDSTFTSYGEYDMYFASYSTSGILNSAIHAGGRNRDTVRKLHVSSDGSIYFTGEFGGPSVLATIKTKSQLLINIVIGKLNLDTPESELVIGTSSTNNLFCAGSAYEVHFPTNGVFNAKNIFSVQVSDKTGSFDAPIELGRGKTSPITVKIPPNAILGSNYRIRVVSTFPEKIGTTNKGSIRIEPVLQQPESITGNNSMCVGSLETYVVPTVFGATAYTWQVPDGWTVTGGQGTTTLQVIAGEATGVISVVAINSCHQSVKREFIVQPKVFAVTAFVTSPAISAGSSTFLSAKGADSYTWEPAIGLSNSRIANPIATPTQTTTYTVTGYKDGCSETAQITITVKSDVNPSNWVWAKQGGNGANTFIETKDITTDTEGNVYMTGDFYGEVSFGGNILNAPGAMKTFIVKYTPQGEVVWAREGRSETSNVTSRGITTDSNNNVYVVGEFVCSFSNSRKPSTVTFNTSTLTAEDEMSEIYIIKYDKNGNLIWLKSAGGNNSDSVKGIGADGIGNIYITGSYYGTARFDSHIIEGTYMHSRGFIAKYDMNGNTMWAHHVDQKNATYGMGSSIAVDESGNSIVAAKFSGAGVSLTKYDNAGNVIWAKEAKEVSDEDYRYVESGAYISNIVLDKEGNAYITGSLDGKLDFGDRIIEAYDNDLLLAKFNAQGEIEWVLIEGNYSAGASIKGLASDAGGNIYVTGTGYYNPEENSWSSHGVYLIKYNASGHLIGSNVINTTGGRYGYATRDFKGSAITIDLNNNIYLTGSFKYDIDFGGSMTLLTKGQEPWHESDFFIAKARSVASLPPATLTIGDIPSTYIPCNFRDTFKIPFTTKGRIHRDNVFNAYLLDKEGKSLGLIGSSAKSPVRVVIPSSFDPGAGYRIRIEATAPGRVWAEKEITLTDFPVPAHIIGETSVCINGAYEYIVPWQGDILDYTWTMPEGWYQVGRIYSHGIVVSPSMNAVDGDITVKMLTNCGQVYTRSLFVRAVRTDVFPSIKTETMCGTNRVKLTASGAPEGGIYNWYIYGGTIPIHTGEVYTPEATEAKTFYVAIKINGCEGPRKVITTMAYPVPTVTAGPDETICSDIESFQLTGFSPEDYGYWSGTGVSPSGMFYPKSVGPGVYKLTYTYSYPFECTYPATKTITVSTCTGIIESKLASKLLIYPNPTDADIHLELPLDKGAALTIRLFDTKGQRIFENVYPKVHGQFKQVIHLKDKPKGVYLLQLILDDGVITKRVVRE